ncbi:hypothetical protein GV67_16535 [Pseudorhizobium pelagicum]|nr:hypothetical protein GV67_16535 [Pseudorhizobium pelagicum]
MRLSSGVESGYANSSPNATMFGAAKISLRESGDRMWNIVALKGVSFRRGELEFHRSDSNDLD